ncbi:MULTISPECIES: phosphodiesterase [unclassified Thermosipho (in: thermotogales)]|uniref:phosphodiesterase n=1 Tax=unclassified Thermosipho (in: thermotogales) TaxID=2676525 RepID=UPI0009847027|nr:phosphodiesterase [Thermosipho sp. 1223]MBT1247589.1 phosphodiesterase [Thermosipho sp. 1244]OOC46174.1 phosphodiesterase [Thermosipho sp. 1223]
MKILVVSDTHGSLENWKKINIVQEVDEIFHLGDILYHGPRNPLPEGYDPKNLAEELKNHKINYIRGNCDADVDLKVLGVQEMPKQSIEYFGKVPVYLFHGEVIENDGFDLISFAKKHNVKVVLHGHTHIPKIEEIDGIIVANPGSLSLPKGGFPPTYMVIEKNNEVVITIFDLNGKEVLKKKL